MTWSPGHTWRGSAKFVQPSTGEQILAYKFCLLNDKLENGGVPHVEPGPDRTVRLVAGGALQQRCVGKWGEGPKLQRIELEGWQAVYGGSDAILFRSPMAFAPMFDTQRTALSEWKAAGVTVLVSLAGPEEMRARVGFDLVSRVWSEGIAVLCHTIDDLCTPRDVAAFRRLVDTLHTLLKRGNRVVVACHAGIGRTGMLIACLAVRHLHMQPQDAIAAIRAQSHFAVQTEEQVRFVSNFA